MTEDITLERVCNKLSWGFRLTGGRDFGSPLTVSRIHGGSISEKGGLQVGDIITHIGSEKANQLTHADAQRCIIECGNSLKLTVLRGSCPDVQRALSPIRAVSSDLPLRVGQHKKAVSTASSIYSLYEDDSFELLDQSDDEFLDDYREPTEKEIDEMLLENAEVLEENGKTVIGVNFHRFIPKCEFIKDSAVFAALQEEQVHKELSEREQLAKCPNKRFSTFLAPPDRPVLMPKRPSEKQKDQTSKCTKPENCTTTSENQSNICCRKSESTSETNESDTDTVAVRTTPTNQPESKNISTEGTENENESTENEKNESKTIYDSSEQIDKKTEDQIDGQVCIREVQDEEDEDETSSKTNSEKSVEFETQLKNIKNTLNTLGELPSMIQSQLQNIQNQINNLLKLKAEQDKSSSSNKCNFGNASGNCNTNEETQPVIEEYEDNEISAEDDESTESYTDYEEELNDENESNQTALLKSTEKQDEEKETNTNRESQNLEKQIDDDLELRKRRVCPLTPLPRPVVLPGGRIWRKPQDAYNEEFIAETLISQAEVLVGSTLGVNFRKYEPPKFDVNNSAVYKLIHNLESKKTGLENRDTVPALQDYYQSPICAKHFYLAKLAERVHSPKENVDEESQSS